MNTDQHDERGPVVVDVGNTRIKWGLCDATQVRQFVALPPDDQDAWQAQFQAWGLCRQTVWVLSGVHPERRAALARWLEMCSDKIHALSSFRQLPIEIAVANPAGVGMDRLLNAVAANRRRQSGSVAVLVDAGSAVTVDYVDADGVFRGGAIFPGFRLMAGALHHYTALLPMVTVIGSAEAPAVTTEGAIQTGVLHAVLGGIERLCAEYQHRLPGPMEIFLTGGDAECLAPKMRRGVQLWPEMTLAGILCSHAS